MARSRSTLIALALATGTAAVSAFALGGRPSPFAPRLVAAPKAAVWSRARGGARMSTTTSEEIIPREVLFGNPEYASPDLSPDGTKLAFLKPSSKGVLNVWLRDLAAGEESDRQVTADEYRGIRGFSWAEDNKHLLYMQDDGGDENFHLWKIETSEGAVAVDLTPFKGAKAQNLITNKRFPDELLIGVNKRNPAMFDMYRCNIATGELTLDTENPGDVVGWGTEDESFEVREATVINQADSSQTVRVRDSPDAEWRELATFPYGEEGGMVDFGPSGSAYMLSSIGRETTALLKVDLATGETLEVVAESDKCNVGGIMVDEESKKVQAVSFNYARTERTFFDEKLKADYDLLDKEAPESSEVGMVSKNRDDTTWVVSFRRDDGPTEYLMYDRAAKKTSPLFVSQKSLLDYKFAHMEDVRIPARDGLELVAYLTRSDTSKATPMVLLVHGGPWARDAWGYNSAAQWFANRGYAVLQVNYRGSSGYSKTFLHKGDKEWGIGSMQHDLTDSVKWAVDQGIAIEDKVAIYGGSYGGYACLAGLAFTPDVYACGVDIVGPSNVKTLLDSIPPYWGPLRNDMLKKIGDVDEDEEFNKAISPLFHIDEITKPLLIGQGANDPRVKQAEADQIAFAMDEKGIPVEYVLYPDEGHGFARPVNRIDFNARAEAFLAKHLGGRAEPAVEKEEKSTAEFPLFKK